MDPSQAWALCLDFIKGQLPSQTFETWFRPTKCFRFDQDQVVIGVPHTFFAEWLEEHYISLIRKAILQILPSVPEISFQVLREDLPHSPTPPLRTPERAEVIEVSLSLNPRYTFDTFVVGNSNQFAHAAARAVAEAPGATAFNPLVIYGGVGLGKTHILQAIAHYCLSVNNVRRIIYVTSEKFFLDFINAIQHGRSAEFSQMYRGADLLLVDDIQFLVNKETTQEEFFHTFNALHQDGKQIVLTSDCPPSELKGLEERLISRFQWGLVADIQPPDLEMRIAILRKKAERDGIELPEDVTLFIAEHITSNIRDLEGALIRLLAASSLTGRDITLDLAKELLKDTITTYTPGNITIELIQKKVCSHYQVPFDLLVGETRKKEVATARQVAMYIAKVLTNSSLKTIGLHFGGRDHSTVIHACQTVESRMQKDPFFQEEVQNLIELCRRGV